MPSVKKATTPDLTFDKIRTLWQLEDPSYKRLIAPSLAKLLHPDTSTVYLAKWIKAMDDWFVSMQHVSSLDFCTLSFSHTLIMDFLNAKLVVTLLKVALLNEQTAKHVSCGVLAAITSLVKAFRDMKRVGEICTRIINQGGVDVLCEIISTVKSRIRDNAVACLMCLLSRSPCNDDMSANRVANVLASCCAYSLEKLLHEKDASTNEKKLSILAIEPCSEVLQRRKIPISRRFSLQILQHRPEIVESLLKIQSVVRPLEDYKRETDGFAAKILLSLMILPQEVVPGLETSLTAENKEEWNAALQCNEILYSCPDALLMLARVRTRLLEEDLIVMHRKITMETGINRKQGNEIREVLWKNRASVMLVSLRLLINLTYIDSAPALLFLALLPLAYETCERSPTDEELLAIKGAKDLAVRTHKKEELEYELRLSAGREDLRQLTLMALVGPEIMLGPTLLFRVLSRVSDAGYGLDKLQRLTSLPHNMPQIQGLPLSLVHVHQITDPRVMGKLIRMGVDRRILGHRDKGKNILQTTSSLSTSNPGLGMATATFVTAAELALALSAFGSRACNESSSIVQQNINSIRKAKQEAVLCLGNASETAGRAGLWQMSRSFAEQVVEFSDTIPAKDAAATSRNR